MVFEIVPLEGIGRTVKYLPTVQLQIPFTGTILNTLECKAWSTIKPGMQIMLIHKEHGQ